MKKVTKQIFALLICAMLLSVTALAANSSATISSCIIDPNNTSKVSVSVQTPSGIQSDDDTLYLFAVPTYVDSVARQTPVASTVYSGDGTYYFSVDLNHNTLSSVLYSKFYVGVKSGGKYTALTGGNFITNAEVIAPSDAPRTPTTSKKGIHVTLRIPTDIETLGVKHAFFNISFQDFISNTPTNYSYDYNGKTYYFTPVIGDYDNLIGNMTQAGISVTLTLINEYMPGYEYMLMPGVSMREGTSNYAINTSTQQGLETVAAATHYLAQRYNGSEESFGQVDNWVVGNEVNDNLLYYYMGEKEIAPFVQEYLQSFRVMHTAIKSAYSNANVYVCLQHRWGTENSTGDYGGKDFIDTFNRYAVAQGNIDWGLSYHPYSFPMNDPDILNDGQPSLDSEGNSLSGGEVTDDLTTPLITMKNLDLLTDYFHNEELLTPDGQVRSIILGEQGYTAYSNITGRNEVKQAANIALAYYIAEMNEDIDSFLLRTHVDEDEGNEYYRYGLWSCDDLGYPEETRFAYDMYRYIDTADTLDYTDFALTALNIDNWASAVKGWDPSVFTSMGSWNDADLYTVSSSTAIVPVTSGMFNQWEPSYNVYDIVFNDHSGKEYPGGTAVANSFAYYREYQGIETHFNTPLNLSAAKYLTMDVKFTPYSADYANDQLEFKVRLHSGEDVFDATGLIGVGTDYTICLDVSQWANRNSIDWIEVLVREHGQTKSFAGTFTVYNLTGASSVSGLQALEKFEKTTIDLSGAELAFQRNFNYSGTAVEPSVTVKLNGQVLVRHKDYDVIYHDNVNAGQGKVVVVGIKGYSGYTSDTFTIQGDFPTVYNGIDYSPVYAYGYYKENNPMVVNEVGDDPLALLEHFVTKGMSYALQGVGNFNVLAYSKINSDLAPEFGADWAAYYMHYLEHGIAEGRSTSGIKPDDMQAPVYPSTGGSGNICIHTGGTATCLEQATCTSCGKKYGGVAPDNHTRTARWNKSAAGHNKAYPCCGATIVAQAGHTWGGNVCTVCSYVSRENMDTTLIVSMYRMYNPNTGEHFYTGSIEERDMLVAAGWHYEGEAFRFYANDPDPVYRLFEPATGEHLYTMDVDEKAMLEANGWQYEGVAFNSTSADEAPQYRLHNPNATVGAYHFTNSTEERDNLIAAGWEYQGIGFYSLLK